MNKLNLPSMNARLKEADGKVWIFDGIRKKYVVLTPEEWVRQHVISYLVNNKGYPKSLIKIEGGLTYNQLQKRSDAVVFDRQGNAWMLVECKEPELELNEAAIQQAFMYNKTLNARYVVITNGMRMLCYEISPTVKLVKELPEFG